MVSKLLLISTLLFAITSAESLKRIVGGMEATAGQFPATVGICVLGDDPISAQIGGGTLIAPEWILTAAHLYVDNSKPGDPRYSWFNSTYAFLDQISLAEKGTQVDIAAVYLHPNATNALFLTTHFVDLALVRLAKPVNTTPAALYTKPVAPGDTITLIGWGATTVDIKKFATVLRYVDLDVHSQDVCAINATYEVIVSENFICAGQEGVSGCAGDSGGPAMIETNGKYNLAGVISFGTQENCTGTWSAAANLQLSWISQVMQNATASSTSETSGHTAISFNIALIFIACFVHSIL